MAERTPPRTNAALDRDTGTDFLLLGAWVLVESSNVNAIKYDSGNEVLWVAFQNGGRYRYANVPYKMAQSLADAPSKGAWVAANLKKANWPFTKEA